jgi:CubicO group peptidase (beta-lactamase class C family)
MSAAGLQRAVKFMDGWLGLLYQRDTIPGISVAVAKKGEIIFSQAYGFADLERKIKLTDKHLFRVASHSKTFTATAIMQLQEQGKLKIDDKVVDYLDWLKSHKDKRWHNVTIRQLLSHGAGVIRDGSKNDYWQLGDEFPDEATFKEDLLKCELVIDNNTRLKYSNYGYTLLGLLIETVSGSTYHQYVTHNIIRPLGLKNTGPEYDERLKDRFATGYSRAYEGAKRKPIEPIDTKAMAAATGFYSTAKDLAVYFSAHLAGNGKLLDDESKKQMQKMEWQAENTHAKDGYGLGFEFESSAGRKLVGHGGGFPGFITRSYLDPKDGLAVIVLTNCNGSWTGYYAKSIFKVIDFFKAAAAKPKWEKFEGRYSDLWWDAQITAKDEQLIASNADSWEPFENPAELTHVSGNNFRIAKTDSFSSLEETVEFISGTSGEITSMVWAGAQMKPFDEYWAMMDKLQEVKVYGKK